MEITSDIPEQTDAWEAYFIDTMLGFFIATGMFIVTVGAAVSLGSSSQLSSWIHKVLFAPALFLESVLASGPENIQSVLREADPMLQFILFLLSPIALWSVIFFIMLRLARGAVIRRDSRAMEKIKN